MDILTTPTPADTDLLSPRAATMRRLVSAVDRDALNTTEKQEVVAMIRKHNGVLNYIENCADAGTEAKVETIKAILERLPKREQV